jgi:hypothetical protein
MILKLSQKSIKQRKTVENIEQQKTPPVRVRFFQI